MPRSPLTLRLLGLTAALLGAAAWWLAFDNPEIDGTSRGDDYSCLAPWDTVLNDADNSPGGEPAPDEADVDSRCRDAGEQRFALAAGSAAGALGVAGGVLAARSRHAHSYLAGHSTTSQ